jgi:broad specificity phosphatase PhoE
VHVLLIRHGRPRTVIDSPSIADPGLCDLGLWQAGRLTDWLACEDIDHVVTSPKQRAIQTAHAVAADRGLTPEVVHGFDEIDRCAHTYIPTELLPTEGGAYWEKISQRRFAEIGWDSPEEFRDRVVSAWDAMCRNPPGERVVLACHGGTIRTILADVVDNKAARFQLEYASISRVEVTAPADPDGGSDPFCTIVGTNSTAHFDTTRTEVVGALRGAGPSVVPPLRQPLSAPSD